MIIVNLGRTQELLEQQIAVHKITEELSNLILIILYLKMVVQLLEYLIQEHFQL